ncbi:class I SAM-dependent methyltransferase [bacterium]|nr:class I SAM-dependent methyltransferase [bacterium]
MNPPADQSYPGQELDLFGHAHTWRAYWSRWVRPWLGGDVLEVGAGLGSNTRWLRTGQQRRWVCLEPDSQLAGRLQTGLAGPPAIPSCELLAGTLADVPADQQFDAILYLDVLEHIADDTGELQQAARRLRPGGRLIVLGPAHQFLFSPMDAAIGHHRRYTKKMLLAAAPPELQPRRAIYLDSCGLLLSLGNRLLLRRQYPTWRQFIVWDRFVVRLSKVLDPLLGRAVGKSVLVVWEKTAAR